MNLKIVLPTGVLMTVETPKIKAEAENGYFTLLPRHIDFVSALVPGILTYTNKEGVEEYVAVDEGILIKNGADVLVSTLNGVAGKDLKKLSQVVKEEFKAIDEREKKARAAMAKIEATVVRQFINLGKEINE